MATTQTIEIELQNGGTANFETLDIAGYTTHEIAKQWLGYYEEYLRDSLRFHGADDEQFREDCAEEGVPAELLNTAEQDAWNLLRQEFGAFGLDAEAEDVVAEIVAGWREDGTFSQAAQGAARDAGITLGD